MKVIISGSRCITSYEEVAQYIEQSFLRDEITEVVSGTAKGVDTLGELWARRNRIMVSRFPADWDHLGKCAGYARNELMAKYADALIAIWDGQSRGTAHMIDLMRQRSKLIDLFPKGEL